MTVVSTTPRLAAPSSLRFLALAAAWNAAFFALLRTSWFSTHATLPVTLWQQAVAAWYGGHSATAVVVTVECSGADAMALAAGVIMAYPASWRRRLAGVATVVPILLLLNIVRIGMLSRVAGSVRLFDALHLYVWPTILVVASAALVLGWMRSVGGARGGLGRGTRLAACTIGGFAVLVPFIYSGAPGSVACRLVASGAAGVLRAFGAHAMASGPLVTTARGAYVVTAECLLTPLIPLWVVAVLSVPLARWQRLVGLALTVPVLGAVAVARLLVLAAPPALVESPLLVVHGFHQLVLFAAIVAVASYRVEARTEGRLGRAASRTALVLGVTLLVSLGVARFYDASILAAAGGLRAWAPHALTTLLPPGDVQGALALLPVYQLALLGALAWVLRSRVVPRRLAAAALTLWVSQVSLLLLLGELAARVGFIPHALAIRAWAVGWPLVLAFLALDRRAARAGKGEPEDYRGFWDRVGAEFPDLGGAASTELYRANEVRLISEHVPDLASKRVLKTDLWDEARNTRILQWMQALGAVVAGIDISGPVIHLARREFGAAPLLAAGADVRALPFADATFDVVYSMGTIEHFAESDVALRECLRVLKPGGLALVGVPNRLDPFLRPVLVRLLSMAGLYAYGHEKSYSRTALGRLVQSAGFDLVGADGILFIPGWLRMLDLFLHTRWPALAAMTMRIPVRAFGWIDRRFPAVRRHGYLIVAVARRPAVAEELQG